MVRAASSLQTLRWQSRGRASLEVKLSASNSRACAGGCPLSALKSTVNLLPGLDAFEVALRLQGSDLEVDNRFGLNSIPTPTRSGVNVSGFFFRNEHAETPTP